MARNPDYQRLLDEARSKIDEVTPQEAHARIAQGAVMLDIRDPDEAAADPSAPGARHISRGRLEGNIGDVIPDKKTPLVVHCQGGGRGALATATLKAMGYENAVNLAGGLKAWKAAYPAG